MQWVLKVTPSPSAFLAESAEGAHILVSDASGAKRFESIAEAETARKALDGPSLSALWSSGEPDVFPIRVATGSFIVRMWAFVFRLLYAFTLFGILQRLFKLIPSSDKYLAHDWIAEAWVVLWTVTPFLALLNHRWLSAATLSALILAGWWRLYEIGIVQANVTLFDEYRDYTDWLARHSKGRYAVRGFRRLVLLTVHNYAEVVFWFALFYWFSSDAFHARVPLTTAAGALYFSAVTMVTLGYGDTTPTTNSSALLTVAHSAFGVFLTVLVLARVISLIPRPITLDPGERAG